VLKVLAAGLAIAAGAAAVDDVNTLNVVLNVVTLVGLLGGAIVFVPRAFRAKQAEADLKEKDRTIETLEQALRAARERITECAEEIAHDKASVAALNDKVAQYRGIAEGYQARYEEASKYSGEQAFRALERESQRRHTELMGVLHALQETVGERRQSNLVDVDPEQQ
jgi:predicted RNase H-like nuclease (RuvC/YqgF family)